ncbi:hypothetical protein BCT86_00095 [Vibrio breoganii]|uniref:acyltransferase n=1 Tax=Vibrio breoganii TaxID=553239 RepID=UPI000C867CBF|nr:acyltransferase [Vibrio breoganii]PML10615.1 hypothetical protein BCT86_00095 [Vibrio breoganii]
MKFLKRIARYILSLRWLYQFLNYFLLIKASVDFGQFPKIIGRIYVKNNGIMRIGKNVTIISDKNSNVIGGSTRANFMVENKAVLTIGDSVGISNSTIVCRDNITIENDVLIGGDCKIFDTDFHSLNVEKRLAPFKSFGRDDTVKTGSILIKKGAWLGCSCIVLKGNIIGEHSVVAAGSVVCCDIPDGEVWGGNPARFIKKII